MDQAQIQQMITTAVQERRAGRGEEAARLFREVVARAGEQPLALNALGLHALAQGEFAESEALLRRAIAADSSAPELWMNLAKAKREQRDDAGEEEALRGALSIDQRHFMALVRMAELLERRGDEAGAADRWNGVLAMAPMIEERSPALDIMLERARDYVVRQREGFAGAVDQGLAAARGTVAPAALRRFDACIDHALGRREIYANHCAGMHFPFLPADEFFAREHFPWIEAIEAQTEVIRAELEAVLAEDAAAIRPYVAMEPGTPTNKWSPLDHSLDWGAMHLWKDGRRDDAVCARVPRTAAAVEALPLSDLPGRTPTVFFSLLRPGAHLPAHTGVSNVRSIIHLPLIVPPGCTFRVGGETRAWQAGQAWAFDDTIEHEAWNRSDQVRAILIFDVWNPYIAPVERDLLRRFYAVAAEAKGAPIAAINLSE
ncbi:MAG: aspartyl/asparaginyl beta-hydroxylase domain-containing protein [Pseudomonadota bacterium]|uniref:aspartyl/asparaginyl beta-hydroxylase domain-containing protein n=1 Tax=Sphingomonas sp. ERG5 TaxID=1381597 RepID=UPI0009DFBEBE|nr:aspartyl/asparaginyl beta-hydroxylase domain-containing protein [Sphingomonas sp. ERG5]